MAIDLVCDGGTITFDDDYRIYLDSALSIGKALTIEGDDSRDVRVFTIGAPGAVTLGHPSIVSSTGGIYNQGTLTVNHSIVVDNDTNEISRKVL